MPSSDDFFKAWDDYNKGGGYGGYDQFKPNQKPKGKRPFIPFENVPPAPEPLKHFEPSPPPPEALHGDYDALKKWMVENLEQLIYRVEMKRDEFGKFRDFLLDELRKVKLDEYVKERHQDDKL